MASRSCFRTSCVPVILWAGAFLARPARTGVARSALARETAHAVGPVGSEQLAQSLRTCASVAAQSFGARSVRARLTQLGQGLAGAVVRCDSALAIAALAMKVVVAGARDFDAGLGGALAILGQRQKSRELGARFAAHVVETGGHPVAQVGGSTGSFSALGVGDELVTKHRRHVFGAACLVRDFWGGAGKTTRDFARCAAFKNTLAVHRGEPQARLLKRNLLATVVAAGGQGRKENHCQGPVRIGHGLFLAQNRQCLVGAKPRFTFVSVS